MGSFPKEGYDLPDSPLVQAALAMHEMFQSLMAGGFTEDQALRLVAHMLATNVKLEGGDDHE